MSDFSIEPMIEQELGRWADCNGSAESTLLRLSILRELIQKLHSEKSRCLANGLKAEAQSIKTWETKIEELKDCANLKCDLLALLHDPKAEPKKKRLLPESLFQNLDRDKLFRYDRTWEAAIAAEAISINWSLWILDTWVKIVSIQEWDQELSQKLWPHGLILFTESSPQMKFDENIQDSESGYWRGQWFTLIHPYYQSPLELSLNLEQWWGAPETPLSPPNWKRIFP